MQELKNKVDEYECKGKAINESINGINKDIRKLEKRLDKENNIVNKELLKLRIVIMQDIIERFNN